MGREEGVVTLCLRSGTEGEPGMCADLPLACLLGAECSGPLAFILPALCTFPLPALFSLN